MAKSKAIAKCKVGDVVTFTRDDEQVSGHVLNVYENSVLVELFSDSAALLGVERTVVSHKNYEVAL